MLVECSYAPSVFQRFSYLMRRAHGLSGEDRNTLIGMTCTRFLVQACCKFTNTAHATVRAVLIDFGTCGVWISLSSSFSHISSFSSIKELGLLSGESVPASETCTHFPLRTLSFLTHFWDTVLFFKSLSSGGLNGRYKLVKFKTVPNAVSPTRPSLQSGLLRDRALAGCAQTSLLSEIWPVPAQRCSRSSSTLRLGHFQSFYCVILNPWMKESKWAPLSARLRNACFSSVNARTCILLWSLFRHSKGSGFWWCLAILGQCRARARKLALQACCEGGEYMASGGHTGSMLFLSLVKDDRDWESYKAKVSWFAGWPRQSHVRQEKTTDLLQAEVGRAGCRGNNGIFSLSWGILSIMFWLAYFECGNVSFCWASSSLYHKSTGLLAKRLLMG